MHAQPLCSPPRHSCDLGSTLADNNCSCLPACLAVLMVLPELTMQIQGSDSTSTSCIRVQREAKISQLPRHQSYCLSGLVTAGLGPYTGHYVTKVSAPGGQRIVLHLSSPAVVAAADAARKAAAAAKAAAEGEGAAAGPEDAATTGEGSDSESEAEDEMDCTAGAADASSAGDAAGGGSGSVSSLAAEEHAGGAGLIAAADDVAVLQVMQGQHRCQDDVAQQQQQQPGCHAVGDSAAADGEGRQADVTRHHRTFWLQRLTRCKQTSLLPVVAEALAAASGAAGAPGDQVQQDEAAPAAAAAVAAPAPGVTPIPSVAPIAVKVPMTSAGTSRLSMFKAILQRQQQQQHKGHGTSPTSSGDASRGDESPNCSSGSSSFTSCGSDVCTAGSSPVAPSMQAAVYPSMGEPMAPAPSTEARAARRAAAACAKVVDSVSLQQEQAAAFSASRKRGGGQTSRLGHLCGSSVESRHIQDWGAAHAAAHIRSKRQKTAAAM